VFEVRLTDFDGARGKVVTTRVRNAVSDNRNSRHRICKRIPPVRKLFMS